MPEDNTSTQNDDQQKTDNNNQQNNSNNSAYTGGGKKFVIGIDQGGGSHGYDDQSAMEKVAKGLEDCGNTVEITQVGPNQETYLKGHGADVAVYLCNGVDAWTMWSFVSAIKSGSLPFTIFGMEGWYHNENEPEGSLADMEHVRAEAYKPPHDGRQSDLSAMQADSNAKTVGEYVDENSQYISLCYAKTPEEMAQNICSGNCGGGGGSGTTTTTSGGGAQVKDKTFEHCIKRICAATDSVFLVENNAAVLFPYTDWMAFTLRHQINQIKAKDMDPDLFEIDYNTDGFYNKVTVVWGADEEQDKVTKDKEDEEDKKTIGNTTTIQKTMPTGGTQLSEQYDPLVNIYGELEKKVTTNFPNEETAHYVMNALLIQYIRDFNNSCRVRAVHNNKYIGGTFYAVENPNTKKSELFYLNSYTIFKEKDQPLVTDLEFKYGPEGAEELLDYQAYGGGGGSSNVSTGDSATEKTIWQEAAKIHYGHDCSSQDPEEAYKFLHGHEGESNYTADCYGMSSYLHYRFNKQANIPCRVVGDSSHHVVMLYKNNAWQKTRQEYRNYKFEYLFKWKEDQVTTVLLEADNPPAGSSTSSNPSGNTADQNNTANQNNGANT